MNIWQSLPLHLHPVAVTVAGFSLYWYAVFFLLGAIVCLWYLRRTGDVSLIHQPPHNFSELILWVLGSTLIGARLGYVCFYYPQYYIAHPLSIVSPYDFVAHAWTGISGMSFFGGLIGGGLGLWWVARRTGRTFLSLSDQLIPALPIALFFGRLGNFFNGELIGRVTSVPWGMYFSGEMVLRHPVTLYEACLEGMVLFVLIRFIRLKWRLRVGELSSIFLLLYGSLRFLVEFYRALDPQIGFLPFSLTFNQYLSGGLIVGSFVVLWLCRSKNGILDRTNP